MATTTDYATIEDIEAYWRVLTEDEKASAEMLIADTSAKIRYKAKKAGKDFDTMIADDIDLQNVAKSIVCKVVINAMKCTDTMPMTQFSESVGGYSISGSPYNSSGGLYISKADWKELGLSSQFYGGLNVYGN